ncbi:MAG TPA: CBS domain-containing protein [Candidatus Acidoferrales bacterium]|nr:CBS domain-containing protein [Candidatus Acidoferrales bacterium]
MKVKDVMVGTPASCTSETNLGSAVEILWKQNCGILPIVDAQQKVIGVVTDRDVSIALGTRNRLPGEITVGQVASGNVFGCKADDDVRTALATMGEAKVRRLPVINANGKLEGILSMDDVVLHSEARIPGRTPELSHDDVVDTLKKLYRPELPRVVPQKAAA